MASDQRGSELPTHTRQNGHTRSASTVATEQDSVRTKYAWLTLYFGLNLALTLYNKAVMGKVNYNSLGSPRETMLLATGGSGPATELAGKHYWKQRHRYTLWDLSAVQTGLLWKEILFADL